MKKVVLYRALISVCCLNVQLSVGQAGSLDTTFNAAGSQPGTNSISVSGLSSALRGMALQTDGKIVEVGSASISFALARYQTNGTLDATFGSGGTVVTPIASLDAANGVVIQSDGKIVAAGRSNAGGIVRITLVRYNTNGTLDTTFGSGGIVVTSASTNDIAFAIALQSDGKIVVTGRSGLSPARIIVVRYNQNGSPDSSFGTGSFGSGIVISALGSSSQGSGVLVQPDGKIVVTGAATIGSSVIFLTRYNTDGTFDSTFNSGGVVTTAVGSTAQSSAVIIQPDGKLIVTGSSDGNLLLARYNTNGSLDPAFGSSGISVTLTGVFGQALALQADGKIVVTGANPLVRFTTNGALDSSFGSGGVATTPITGFSRGYGVAVQTDGKIVVGADGTNGGLGAFFVMRYLGGANLIDVCSNP